MLIDILTIFPEFFTSPIGVGNVKIAREKGLLDLRITDIRDYSRDRHRKVDDYGFGGGPGMVMMVQPIYDALKEIKDEKAHVVLFTPRGNTLTQNRVNELKEMEHLVFICGRYKGIDARLEHFVDEEISIGDYVVSGGEYAALIVIDAVARLMPGVIGDIDSAMEDSYSSGLLDAPRYTRPREFMGMKVPDVLLSGNHKEIEKWRRTESLKLTLARKPYLLKEDSLNEEDRKIIKNLRNRDGKEE
ncbi:MAG TPA: tRNA (guanosine(37)-N1)-methyltransferase TrmD [Firmicutes bacterium]|uniref:tRNA (guanine-N(1)-)-methyltransferase n=1 Tax=candidate division TA06 bacterium TaxID=2250710 RepID=A0A660S7I0_UNCT6|nr:MAG: tRNA (guanosine(37)-N1)-methyltransferase TrmD [candidate division TA06 bacterium]HFD05095.1 tRNA (guanosine(37)-N1)-methyltransferase TrmD [Bacillota bacterium]